MQAIHHQQFLLTCVMISAGPVRRDKNLNAIDVINVRLCMMVLLIELYLFIPLSVALTIFQGHSSVKPVSYTHLTLPTSDGV